MRPIIIVLIIRKYLSGPLPMVHLLQQVAMEAVTLTALITQRVAALVLVVLLLVQMVAKKDANTTVLQLATTIVMELAMTRAEEVVGMSVPEQTVQVVHRRVIIDATTTAVTLAAQIANLHV